MSTLLSLSDDLLKLILQHVPLRHRLSSCSLAHSRLQSAAGAATQALHLCHWHGPTAAWLAHHGQHSTSLRLEQYRHPLQLLPCSNLLKLRVDDVQLQLSVLEGCTKLTYLELQCVKASTAAMRSLSCLQRLQHLQLWQPARQAFLPKGTLAALTQLTYIRLRSWSADNLRELGALTALKHLHLCDDSSDDSLIGPSTVPGLEFPASLTRLQLLSKVEADVLHLVPTRLQDLSLGCAVEGPVEGPGSWLAGVARLQQLTHLYVGAGDDEDCAWPQDGSAYTALTAISHLQSILLSWTEEATGPPEGFWLHVFPASRSLPHLTSVCFEDGLGWNSDVAWGAADLSRLVRCCPNLCAIESITPRPGLHVSELHKLTALTCIEATYDSLDLMGDDTGLPEDADPLPSSTAVPRYPAVERSLEGLATITQLQCLRLEFKEPCITVTSLLPLTRLSALTELGCGWPSDGDHEDDHSFFLCASHLRRDCLSTDVWLRLLVRCSEEPSCSAAARRSLVQQLDQHRVLTVRQQEQLEDQQEEIDDLREQLSAQQQAAAEEAASLQAQVQELQAELQQLRQTQPR